MQYRSLCNDELWEDHHGQDRNEGKLCLYQFPGDFLSFWDRTSRLTFRQPWPFTPPFPTGLGRWGFWNKDPHSSQMLTYLGPRSHSHTSSRERSPSRLPGQVSDMGPPRNEDLTFRTGSARALPGCVEESGRSPTETPSSSRPSVGLRLPPKAQRGRAPLGSPRLIQRPEHTGTGPGGRRRSPPAAPPSGFLRGLLPTPVPPPALGSAAPS